MPGAWTTDSVLELARSYQPASILMAAAELDLFSIIAEGPLSAAKVTGKLGTDLRATTMLLDALAALELIDKCNEQYALPPATARILSDGSGDNVLPMVRHQANCLRRWAELARTIQTGQPAQRGPSIRGQGDDEAAFIDAMDNVSAPVASQLIEELGPPVFNHLLDVGGASGTWSIAFLKARPDATATLFDLPHVIPMAKRRISDAQMGNRIKLVAGDFLADPLPRGADIAWVSAIVHQNSPAQNRQMFTAIADAPSADGQILIRDMLMDDSRTSPAAGALFAINMLVATAEGTTYTFDELREDLEAAGFTQAAVQRRDDGMNSIVHAAKARKA